MRREVDEHAGVRCGVDPLGHTGVCTGVGEDRPVHAREQIEVTDPRRTNRTDNFWQLRVEQCNEAGDPFDVLFDDRIGFFEAPLRPGDPVVVDLDGQDRSVCHRGVRRQTGECRDTVERRQRLVGRPHGHFDGAERTPWRQLDAGVCALVRERADADGGDSVDVDDQGRWAQCVEAHVAALVGLDDQPVRRHGRDRAVEVEVRSGDGAVRVRRNPAIAAKGRDVSRPHHLVDGQLTDDRLAADRFRNGYAQHPTSGNTWARQRSGVGSLVGERVDADVRNSVDVDDQGRWALCVEADVAVGVGFDNQPVGRHR